MKRLSDDSYGFADSPDFVFAAAPAQGASTGAGGTPAPVLGAPIDVPQEVLEAEAAFAASGTGGAGSVVTVGGATSAGLTINLMFDAAAMAAPQSFRDGITQAMQMICAVVTDHITLNIQIDYSGTGGGAFAGPSGGNYVSYSTVHADLVNNASPGDTTFNSLPSGSTIAGQSQVAVWYSQEKLWGLLSPTGTEVDGSATFATDINPNLLVGVALHELTHAMGRVPYGPYPGHTSITQPDVFDFFRFTSSGNILINGDDTAPAAYFSLDGGAHKIADYGQTSDPSDFLNSGVQGSTDPFNEFYSSSTQQQLTAIDLKQLDALGFHLVSNQPTTVIEAKGSTELVQVGSNYFLNPVAGGTGPELKYQGAPVTTGEFGAYVPLGVEAVSGGGYEVAWFDPSHNVYSIWSTDSSGNYTGNLYLPGSGSTVTFESFETSFQQDLNGDGVIGVPPSGTVIEANGSTEVVKVGSNYFLDPAAGGTGPELKYQGAPVTSGEFGGYVPIGAEAVSGGYEVAWFDPSRNVYSVWSTDTNGNYTGNLYVPGAGNSVVLESLESSFQQDLNGDGHIGLPAGTSLIEGVGTTALVQAGNNFFLDPVSGGTGPELKYQGSPVTSGEFGAYVPIGAEPVSGGYEVAWFDPSQNVYSVWSTDSSGNYTGNLYMPGAGNSATFEALETSFQQDLNGDHTIGVPGHTSPSAQVASIAPPAPASLGGGDTFAFRPDLGSTGSNNSPPAALEQIGQQFVSGIEHLGTEIRHILAGDLPDLMGTHDATAYGPLSDLLHGFIIH
jgi:serralysin